jgi:hypothetical protein
MTDTTDTFVQRFPTGIEELTREDSVASGVSTTGGHQGPGPKKGGRPGKRARVTESPPPSPPASEDEDAPEEPEERATGRKKKKKAQPSKNKPKRRKPVESESDSDTDIETDRQRRAKLREYFREFPEVIADGQFNRDAIPQLKGKQLKEFERDVKHAVGSRGGSSLDAMLLSIGADAAETMLTEYTPIRAKGFKNKLERSPHYHELIKEIQIETKRFQYRPPMERLAYLFGLVLLDTHRENKRIEALNQRTGNTTVPAAAGPTAVTGISDDRQRRAEEAREEHYQQRWGRKLQPSDTHSQEPPLGEDEMQDQPQTSLATEDPPSFKSHATTLTNLPPVGSPTESFAPDSEDSSGPWDDGDSSPGIGNG